MRRLAVLLSLLILAGCQTSQVVANVSLVQEGRPPPYGQGYSLPAMIHQTGGEILAVLAFSGGGKRSAAFAHGVLRGLRQIPVIEHGMQRTLLDEVDFIAAVSGGSFPAMHYGLYRDKSFETFPQDFLYQDIDSYIWGMYLLPWNWEWLINPLFGTNDRMAEIYDRLMFHGATYADLMKRGLPVISVNATDISYGESWAFTQTSFDLICSDLSRFPVARAVAASNGFPVLFTPITLTSHRADCGQTVPPGVASLPAAEANDELSRPFELHRLAERYLDASHTRYVHLMDGGIADNLAMRAMMNAIITSGGDTDLFRRIALVTRRVLLISADGQAATDPTLPQKRVVTGLGQIFSAVSGTQIDAYNFETLLLADQQVKDLVRTFRAIRCSIAPRIDGYPCDDVQGALVHLSLEKVADPAERERLLSIPTGLTIPNADADDLVTAGERMVRQDPTIRALTENLDAPAAVVADSRRK